MIALFDSGVGGLTVLQSLRRRMPLRDYLYMCDQANFPYGDRPPEEVRRDVTRFAKMARAEGAEAFVLACNTATAIALDASREVFGERTYGVIGAAAEAARRQSPRARIGILATTNTCRSHAYRDAVGAKDCVAQVACPELIALAERGGAADAAIDDAAAGPLQELRRAGADVVVLGCTHLPHFGDRLRALTVDFAQLVDPGEEVAAQVAADLPARSEGGRVRCLTTGDPQQLRGRFEELLPGVRARFAAMPA